MEAALAGLEAVEEYHAYPGIQLLTALRSVSPPTMPAARQNWHGASPIVS